MALIFTRCAVCPSGAALFNSAMPFISDALFVSDAGMPASSRVKNRTAFIGKDGEIIIRIDEDEEINDIEEKSMDYQKYIIYSLTIILVVILIIIFKPKKSIRRK